MTSIIAQSLKSHTTSTIIDNVLSNIISPANAPTLNGEAYMIPEPKPKSEPIRSNKTIATDNKQPSNYDIMRADANLSDINFTTIPIDIGVQFAVSVITKLLTDLFNDDDDGAIDPYVQLHLTILSLKEDLKKIRVDLQKYSEKIIKKLNGIIASTNYIESYLKSCKDNNNPCIIGINICDHIKQFATDCANKFKIMIFQELNVELLNYFLHKDRFGDESNYDSVLYIKLCAIIENIILLHINIIDIDLLNKCIIIYCKIRLEMKENNIIYDKKFLIVRKLQESLDTFSILHESTFNDTKQIKLTQLDIAINKCIFVNKYHLKYLASRKKDYELANLTVAPSNGVLCYRPCFYECERYLPIETLKTNANIANISKDNYIIAFPNTNNILIKLIPLELKINLFSVPKLKQVYDAAKLGLVTISHTYSVNISDQYQYNMVPKTPDFWDDYIDDGQNYICIKTTDGYQDSTHGQILTFEICVDTILDGQQIATIKLDIKYIVGGSQLHGYWVVDHYAPFGYFRLNPNFIGNYIIEQLKNLVIIPSITNIKLVNNTIDTLQEYIFEERRIIHSKYLDNSNLKLELSTNIDISESSIYSTNLVELKTKIVNEPYTRSNYNLLDIIE